MVNITRIINEQTKISSERNSVQTCRKCINEIIDSLVDNEITVETAFAILDECKSEIRSTYEQKVLKRPT